MNRIATVNVNGIRAAVRRGFAGWLADCGADAVLLQEVRAADEDIPAGVFDGWSVAHAAAERAGRNGVAILTRSDQGNVRVGFGDADPAGEFAADGRWVEVDTDLAGAPATVVSVYVPKGGVGTPAQDAKDRFCAAMRDRMRALLESGRPVVLAGDLNVAHTPADIRAWKANEKHAGFLPYERNWYGSLLADGWRDVVREQNPDAEGPYSWWSWRGKAFDNDAGWRIDVVLATADLAARVRGARVDRAPSYADRMSDHAPVLVELAPVLVEPDSGRS